MSIDSPQPVQADVGQVNSTPFTARLSSWVDRGLEVFAAFLIAVIVLDVTLGVVTRYLWRSPLAWTEELARFAFLWLIFIGAAVGMSRESHVAVDSLVAMLPERFRSLSVFIVDVLVSAACMMLLVSGLDLVQLTTGTLTALGWPDAWRYGVIPIGAALSLFFIVLRPEFDRPGWGLGAVLIGVAIYECAFRTGLFTLAAETASPSVIMVTVFAILLAGGVPVAFTMIAGGYLAAWAHDLLPPVAVAQSLGTGVDTFILIAIPLFILTGNLMNLGGATTSLFALASALVGHFRGGLAHVNIVTSFFIGGISGSSVADAAGLTKVLVPTMIKEGYGPGFSTAVTSASSILPNVVPPSIAMLTFASITNVSVGSLFLAGYLPGAALAGSLMLTAYVISRRRGYGAGRERATGTELLRALLDASPALFLMVLIIGGIRGGFFTPTEAGAAAAVYSLFVGFFVYRSLTWHKLWQCLTEGALDTASVGLLISASAPFGWILIAERIPEAFGQWALGFSQDALVLLLVINVILFLVGLPLEPTPAMLILVPIFSPLMTQLGIDPVHFGIIVITNLMIGSITPPVGVLVFITSSIARVPVAAVFREVTPFMLAMMLIVLILTYVPAITLFIPHLFGG